jgi:hypothetical protein
VARADLLLDQALVLLAGDLGPADPLDVANGAALCWQEARFLHLDLAPLDLLTLGDGALRPVALLL